MKQKESNNNFAEVQETIGSANKFRNCIFISTKISSEGRVENIGYFLARCRLHAKNANLVCAEETEELFNEQIIAGTRNPELQKQLLSNGETLTLQEHLNRNYEASL